PPGGRSGRVARVRRRLREPDRRVAMAASGVALTPARKRLRRRERGLGYLLLIPSLVIFGVFVFWPLAHNVYLGFYRTPPFPGLPSTYVGFDQYQDVLTSQTFVDSVKTTFLFALLPLPLGTP